MRKPSLKLNAKIINSSYGTKSYLFTFLVLSAKLFFVLSALFCAFTLYSFIHSELNGKDTVTDILYYVLFSLGIAFSICFYILLDHTLRRAFFKTTSEKCKFEFFTLLSVKLQLKIIYLHLLRFVRSIICAVFFLIPSAATAVTALYFLRDGMDKRIFFACCLLFVFFLFNGIFFSLVSAQKFALIDETVYSEPELSISDTVKAAKEKTQGRCFDLAKLKLSFLPKILLCIFVVPLIFVAPYYLRSVSIYAKQALKVKPPKPAKEMPVMITKILKSDTV